jgi:hypothetical protein
LEPKIEMRDPGATGPVCSVAAFTSANSEGCGGRSSRPKTASELPVPTYTLRFATVGSENFTNGPGTSRAGSIWLL